MGNHLACLYQCAGRGIALLPVLALGMGVSVSFEGGISEMFKYYIKIFACGGRGAIRRAVLCGDRSCLFCTKIYHCVKRGLKIETFSKNSSQPGHLRKLSSV